MQAGRWAGGHGRHYRISDARAYYLERVAAAGLEMNTGDCPPSAGEPAGPGEGIAIPTGIEGSETRMACFVRDGYAHLRLLIPGRDVYVGVAGRSPGDDLSALVDWSKNDCTGCSSEWLWRLPQE